ncbi:MAG: hydrogen peroxide-inducible genes activator [Rhodospirillales bacterium]|nr:hydrogen peroxide-inducible genes activator [Rhodospirillales bacterium]
MRPLPTLRQLRYLVAVAEHRHFGRAAEDCLVTQSTLSAGIRELEDVLGATLVGRSKRRIAMTPLGEDIVQRARAMLRAANDMVDAVEAGTQPLSGLLRLGVIPTVAPYVLPKALPSLRADYPRLRLYLREDQTARVLDLLDGGRLDGAIIALPYATNDLEIMPLGDDALLIACPKTHRFAGRERLQSGELASERMLLLEDGHCLRDHALTACRLLPGQANEDLQATSLGTLMQMVASGLGLTFVPAMAVDVETRGDTNLTVVPLADGHPSRQIALVWRPESVRTQDMRLLGNRLKDFVVAPLCGLPGAATMA